MILPPSKNPTVRPEAYAIEFTQKLQVDIVNLAVAVRDNVIAAEGRSYHSDHEITGMASELCVSLARGLKDLIKYSKEYAVKNHLKK